MLMCAPVPLSITTPKASFIGPQQQQQQQQRAAKPQQMLCIPGLCQTARRGGLLRVQFCSLVDQFSPTRTACSVL
jgi:hypothetical protein